MTAEQQVSGTEEEQSAQLEVVDRALAQLAELLEADDQALRSELGALVAARKKIAHGDGEAVTPGKALRWYEAADALDVWLIERFDSAVPAETRVAISA